MSQDRNGNGDGNTLTGRHTRPTSSSGHPAIWDVFDGSAGSTGFGLTNHARHVRYCCLAPGDRVQMW